MNPSETTSPATRLATRTWWCRLVPAVERLESFPQSGRVVPERNDEGIREVIMQPYRIVYRLRPGLAEIVTVFRASRQFPEAT